MKILSIMKQRTSLVNLSTQLIKNVTANDFIKSLNVIRSFKVESRKVIIAKVCLWSFFFISLFLLWEKFSIVIPRMQVYKISEKRFYDRIF